MQEQRPEVFFEDAAGLFVGIWDGYPVRPGHALLVPKRHIQYFRDMNEAELRNISGGL